MKKEFKMDVRPVDERLKFVSKKESIKLQAEQKIDKPKVEPDKIDKPKKGKSK